MYIQIKKNTKNFILAYTLYYISLIMLVINMENARVIRHGLVLISSAILLINIGFRISNKVILSNKDKFILFFSIIILIISLIFKDFFIISLFLFSLNIDNIEYNTILKLSIVILSIITLLVVSLCLLGILENVQTQRVGNIKLRYGWGFNHSNVLPLIVLYMIIYYYTYKKKVTFYSLVGFQFICISLYYLCHSRNAIISLEILFFLLLIYYIFEKFKSRFSIIYKNACIICTKKIYAIFAIISLVLLIGYKYRNPLVIMIDSVLTGRFRLADKYFSNASLSFFVAGTYHDFASHNIPLDNGYLYIYARYGIIYMILLIWLITHIIKQLIYDKNIVGIICILVLSATNFIDNGFLSYGFYPYLLIGLYHIRKQYHKSNFEKFPRT